MRYKKPMTGTVFLLVFAFALLFPAKAAEENSAVKVGDLEAAVILGPETALLECSPQQLKEGIGSILGGIFTVDFRAYPGLSAVGIPLAIVKEVEKDPLLQTFSLQTQDFCLKLDGTGLLKTASAGTESARLVFLYKAVEQSSLTQAQRQLLHDENAPLYALALVVEEYDEDGNKKSEQAVTGWNGELSFSWKGAKDNVLISGIANDAVTYYPVRASASALTFQATGTGIYAVEHCRSLAYKDLDPRLWYHRYVDICLEKGLLDGISETTFAPNEKADRETVVTALWHLAGEPIAPSAAFTDCQSVKEPGAVSWAAYTKITQGTSPKTFVPGGLVTREQLAAFLYRYAMLQGSSTKKADLQAFSDLGTLSSFGKAGVEWAVAEGLLTGRPGGRLAPQEATTRGELAAVLARFAEMQAGEGTDIGEEKVQ